MPLIPLFLHEFFRNLLVGVLNWPLSDLLLFIEHAIELLLHDTSLEAFSALSQSHRLFPFSAVPLILPHRAPSTILVVFVASFSSLPRQSCTL